MRKTDRKPLFGIAALTAGLLFLGTAYAWYGDPWYRPYGSGAVTYERQNMMRQHGYAMDQLADMLQGRHLLDRDEAVRLVRELEAGFGDELIRNFPPGTVVAGSRTSPRTWRYFGAFRNNADAAEQAASRGPMRCRGPRRAWPTRLRTSLPCRIFSNCRLWARGGASVLTREGIDRAAPSRLR